MSATVISVSMHKGGVGKTSLVSNLAGALTKKHNKRVLIIDTDGQGNSAIAFGIVPDSLENTIYDVFMGTRDPKEVILSVDDNLHILPSNNDMNFIELDILPNLSKFTEPFKILKNTMDELREYYDFIFIDTPPSMGLIQSNVLTFADKVIIPYVPETFAVNGLIRIYKAINEFKEESNPELDIMGVVGMMVDSRTTLHSSMLQQARLHCIENDIHMFETVIPRSIRFASSTMVGKPATWTDSNNHLVGAYFELLDELLERVLITHG